jgi:RNA-binding protein
MSLTSKQKKYLKGLAHSMDSLLQVGKAGVSDEFLKEADRILTEHELIKVKIAAMTKDDFKAIAADVCAQTNSELVHLIGRIAIVYRQSKIQERRTIKIPE